MIVEAVKAVKAVEDGHRGQRFSWQMRMMRNRFCWMSETRTSGNSAC
jgi:hypothetical protein